MFLSAVSVVALIMSFEVHSLECLPMFIQTKAWKRLCSSQGVRNVMVQTELVKSTAQKKKGGNTLVILLDASTAL